MPKVVTGMSGATFGSYTSIALPQFAPAVPASGTPVANVSGQPMQVVITGGTMTNVSVNSVTAGAGAGTYTVPAGGFIVMTYTVAPAWAWSFVPVFLAAKNSDGSPVARTPS